MPLYILSHLICVQKVELIESPTFKSDGLCLGPGHSLSLLQTVTFANNSTLGGGSGSGGCNFGLNFTFINRAEKQKKKLLSRKKKQKPRVAHVSDNSLTIPNRRIGNDLTCVRWLFFLSLSFYQSIDLVGDVCISKSI